PEGVEAPVAEKPKRSRKKKIDEEAAPVMDAVEAPAEEVAPPKRSRRKKADVTEAAEPQAVEAETPVEPPAPQVRTSRAKATAPPVADNDANGAEGQSDEPAADGTARRGWWQRTFGEQDREAGGLRLPGRLCPLGLPPPQSGEQAA